MKKAHRSIASLFGMALVLGSAPALADVKAGVDAWGRGDYQTAISEWRGPAAKGDADAQFNLGQAYKLGRGVPQDLVEAEKWYRKAAEQGHLQASDNYGLVLFQSNRRAEALPYLQASAQRGEPRAQYVLGTGHFNGDFVEKDWIKAYALMTRASAQQLPQATKNLAQMDRFIPIEDRRRAIELAGQMEQDEKRIRTAQVGGLRPSQSTGAVKTAKLPPSRPAMPDPAPAPAAAPITPGVTYAEPAAAAPAAPWLPRQLRYKPLSVVTGGCSWVHSATRPRRRISGTVSNAGFPRYQGCSPIWSRPVALPDCRQDPLQPRRRRTRCAAVSKPLAMIASPKSASGRLSGDPLIGRDALNIQQRRQIIIFDRHIGRLRSLGLGMIGDAEARALQHRDVIGAVPDRHAQIQ